MVQLVAPVWSPAQAENLVWPTDQMRLPEVKFTTSEFFLAVRAELANAHQLDPRYCFTLLVIERHEWLCLVAPAEVRRHGDFRGDVGFPSAAAPAAGRREGPSLFPLSFAAGFHSPRAAGSGLHTLQKAGAIVELQI